MKQFLLLLIVMMAHQSSSQKIRVDMTPRMMTNSFEPNKTLGATMDMIWEDFDWVYSKPIVNQSLSSGWGPISYRQHTEQSIGVWHWNPTGTWSDPDTKSGYFTSSSELGDPISKSYGYSLPHRGNTQNYGTEGGHAVMTDADLTTYWKSNPYLTTMFTGDDDSLHPQFVVFQFDKVEKVNSVMINWAHPYAKEYTIDYWIGDDAMANPGNGVWKIFPNGTVHNNMGGIVLHNLSSELIPVQFIRIWMTQSSNTCDTHGSNDPRNCVGYAINELYGGILGMDGKFTDFVKHIPSSKQTKTYCSSIDPWHTSTDIEVSSGIQTGFDTFFTSGITNNLPAVMAVSVLYGTPKDSAAQIDYIKKRGYPVSYIEVGEEPDGQFVLPEDYAELYLQWATAIHEVDPEAKLGGPVFTGVNEDVKMWPDSQGRTSWMGRFVDYLKSHGRIKDLAFVSFEHYPFAPCNFSWSDLYLEPGLVSHIVQVWKDDGVPDVPMLVTESGISWSTTMFMTDIFGALWLADFVGAFLNAGVDMVCHTPVQPEILSKCCDNWCTESNFIVDNNYQILQYASGYHASRLINFEWVTHGSGIHNMYPASSDITDKDGNILVTVYAVHCPNGEWSLLLVNRDKLNSHTVTVTFHDTDSGSNGFFVGQVKMVTFGSTQYVWNENGANSRADPDLPPVTSFVDGGDGVLYTLPKASINVLRGGVK